MEITFLVKLFIGLVILLAILIFFLLRSAKAKRLKRQKNQEKKTIPKPITLNDLRDRLKNKKLSSEQLKETLDLVIKEYGVIDSFEIYVDIILRMTRHPNANKDIVIGFDKELSKLNPQYAKSIGDNVTLGLNSR